MRLRISSIAVLIGTASTALCWITLQPALKALLDAVQRSAPLNSPPVALVMQLQRVLPFYLALDLVVATVAVYVVLQWMVGRPLSQAEASINQLASSPLDVAWDGGGPLLARLQRALRRMAEALKAEQATTRDRLAELKASNTQLIRAQSELVASDRLATVGKLAAGVAHEVGNPLSGILGYLSLLRSRGSGSAETLDLVTRIEGEVQRIDQIVRALLELGRPSRGQPGPVELAPLLTSSVRLLSNGPDFKQVKIALEVSPGLFASCEPGPLSQVVINLMINAAQAMRGEGALEISASALEGQARIAVRDHGPGLAPQVLARLFEPFFTTKAAGSGTGLGLAVSRHLVEAMGGRLVAGNHPAGGALFTVSLPLP